MPNNAKHASKIENSKKYNVCLIFEFAKINHPQTDIMFIWLILCALREKYLLFRLRVDSEEGCELEIV